MKVDVFYFRQRILLCFFCIIMYLSNYLICIENDIWPVREDGGWQVPYNELRLRYCEVHKNLATLVFWLCAKNVRN